MNRKERRAMARKVRHLQKTKPWELQAMIAEEYDRELVESRMNDEILAPGDKVMIDVPKIMQDPEYSQMKPEFRAFIKAHANEVFTLRKEAHTKGPFGLVTLLEDETEPRWAFYLGHLKKVNSND